MMAVTGTAATWLGILLAYDSYYWPPHGHGWPVSFFVVAVVVAGYVLSYARLPWRRRESGRAHLQEPETACSLP
jgi:zinc/manganese transport system permease protein